MTRPYFAYGSNLCVPRLRHRVPGVRPVGVARLRGWRLRWHKRGADGSGKCSIAESPVADMVHGGLFHVPASERPLLDRVEELGRGYVERRVAVGIQGRLVEAWTYVAQEGWVDSALRPFEWYRALVAAGGRDLGLPATYVAALHTVPVQRDPDRERAASNLRFLQGPAAEPSTREGGVS